MVRAFAPAERERRRWGIQALAMPALRDGEVEPRGSGTATAARCKGERFDFPAGNLRFGSMLARRTDD